LVAATEIPLAISQIQLNLSQDRRVVKGEFG
jgi:hypothetical protein